MKVTHISVYDTHGGAARAAYRLHAGLRNLGHESRMLVHQKYSSDASVIPFDTSLSLPLRARRMLRRKYIHYQRAKLKKLPEGLGFFSDERSQYGADVLGQLPDTDVLNLHWITGFLDYDDFFEELNNRFPVVWTLHDMNAFTGGCHFDRECGQFTGECGACPLLESGDADDFSNEVWKRKKEALEKIRKTRLQIVTPSRWMAGEAKRSSLLGGYPICVIPYGLDTEIFQPRDRKAARAEFGIPEDAKVVLFVADWASEKRKGLDLLFSALEGLSDISNLCLVAVGRGIPTQRPAQRLITMDYVTEDAALARLYSGADLFVIPSLQDNFPNTALESLACGTPIVGFAAGGLLELVREGETGRLAEVGNVDRLQKAIRELLVDTQRRTALGKRCREIAVSEYALEIPARKYMALYAELAARAPKDPK